MQSLNIIVDRSKMTLTKIIKGNYYLHEIVKSGDYELRVELEDQDGIRAFDSYTNFMIGEPSTSYTLEVSGHYGNASM